MTVECTEPDCNREFDSEMGMKRHRAQMHDNSEKESDTTYECNKPGCSREFNTDRGRKIHQTQYHDQGKTDDEMLEDLRRIATELGQTPSKDQLTGRDDCYTSPMYRKRFGSWNNALREAGLEINLDHDRRIELECDYCGDEFERVPFRLEQKDPDSVFCTNECRVSSLADVSKEEALGWIDGRSYEDDYAYRYNQTFRQNREVVLERDGNKCRVCQMTNEEHLDEYEMGLHVHHINPVANFESHDNAHQVDNLITLCLPCHRRWEGIPLRPQTEPPAPKTNATDST